MMTKKSPKSPKIFNCEKCYYTCFKQSEWSKHILTRKHIKDDDGLHKNLQNLQKFTCGCGNIYKYRQGLWNHKKKCNIEVVNNENNISNNDSPDKELIMFLIKQNTEIVKENVEFKQLIIDQNKQMIELSKNVGNNNNNNITNKNKFNLNFFLNETCKDAMNLTDFVSSIKLQLQDLENVGKNGYVSGISNIIVKNLNALEINKRPVHCSDLKREIMYVKDENKWEREKEKEKLAKAINKVSYKNVLQIPAWQKEHPGCEYSHNKENDKYLHMVHESMGASTEEEKKENINKIITKIAKEVVIEKEGE